LRLLRTPLLKMMFLLIFFFGGGGVVAAKFDVVVDATFFLIKF